MTMQREFSFKSANKKGNIQAYIWEPAQGVEKKAIVQICHGASEHALRYADFAQFLANNGYVVVSMDYLGHGKSGNGHFGFIASEGGHKILAKDTFYLSEFAKNEYLLPLVIFGFGMGSLIARYAC